MVPVDHEGDCMQPAAMLWTQSKELAVRVERPAAGDAVPPVGRWDWNDAASVQYVGIRCPTGWCELYGTAKHASSPKHTAPSDLSGAQGQVVRVKGWYDEQYLASTKDYTHGIDGARGTVFPDPSAGGLGLDRFIGRWQRKAWVSPDRYSAGYKVKANFGHHISAGAGGTYVSKLEPQRTRVDLCYLPSGTPGCLDVATTATVTPKPVRRDGAACPADSAGGRWFARITAPDDRVKYVCVIYRPTPDGSQPPHVARWRWSTRDELIWIECPAGCCEVEVDNGTALGP
jgi:hypothetical protein